MTHKRLHLTIKEVNLKTTYTMELGNLSEPVTTIRIEMEGGLTYSGQVINGGWTGGEGGRNFTATLKEMATLSLDSKRAEIL